MMNVTALALSILLKPSAALALALGSALYFGL